MSEFERVSILRKRNSILSVVKAYIDTNLDPSSRSYETPGTIDDILNSRSVTVTDYYEALSVSEDSAVQIHLKRPPDLYFVNNYIVIGLTAWEADIDIQPVFNQYKPVSYICVYFSKAEDATSEAMKQAAELAMSVAHTKREHMTKVARAYLTKCECSVQEAVYHAMPQL